MVGDTGFEPVAPCVSSKYSTPELIAHAFLKKSLAKNFSHFGFMPMPKPLFLANAKSKLACIFFVFVYPY